MMGGAVLLEAPGGFAFRLSGPSLSAPSTGAPGALGPSRAECHELLKGSLAFQVSPPALPFSVRPAPRGGGLTLLPRLPFPC